MLAAMKARLLTAAVALTVSPFGAYADAPPPSAPEPAPAATYCCQYVPIPDWTGVYTGIHAGYAKSDAGWTFPFAEAFSTVAGQGFSMSSNGPLFGGHVGINYQFWRVVVGAETSFTFESLNDTVTGPIPGRPTDRFKIDTSNLWTVTGRLGVALDKFLIYGKGGFASTDVEVSGLSSTGVVAQTNQRENGWIVGGGVDMRLFTDVLFGLEYDYIDIASGRLSTQTAGQS